MKQDKEDVAKIHHWRNCLCQVNVNYVNTWDGKGGIDGVYILMRLKVNQNLTWVMWEMTIQQHLKGSLCNEGNPAELISVMMWWWQVPAEGNGISILTSLESQWKNALESDSDIGDSSVLCCLLPAPSSWLIFPVGEDPETRRLRTVKNIADLRQNLEETMSSLRGTQVTHRWGHHCDFKKMETTALFLYISYTWLGCILRKIINTDSGRYWSCNFCL